jgi:hypothetical protein
MENDDPVYLFEGGRSKTIKGDKMDTSKVAKSQN